MVVEQAFGRLKQRWRCLLKRCDANVTNANIIIAACATLHNICERWQDFLDLQNDATSTTLPDFREGVEDNTSRGEVIRNVLKDLL